MTCCEKPLPKPLKTIIGIDPGTIVTGYAIVTFGETRPRIIDFGCIRPPKKYHLSERYYILFSSLCHLLKIHMPHEMAIETPFVNKNPQSALKLGGAMSCAIIAAKSSLSIPVFGYSPREVKQGITGKGDASKEDVQAFLRNMLCLQKTVIQTDATDALAIALYHEATGPLRKKKEL